MEIKEPYVFYDEDGNLWRADFGSCDNALNPTSMWAGTAEIIKKVNEEINSDLLI